MFEFDSDDEIIMPAPAPAAAVEAAQASSRAEGSAAAAERAQAPSSAAPSSGGVELEFDSDDEITDAAAPPAPAKLAAEAAVDGAAADGAAAVDAPPPPLPPRKRSALASGDEVAFCASATFEGAREGYAFKAGESGVGYYADAAQPRKKKRKGVSFVADKSTTVDARATVARVCAVLGTCTDPAKAAKVLAMLKKLAETPGAVSSETAPLFVAALRTFAASGVVNDVVAQPLADLVDVLVAQPKAAFGAEDRSAVVTWSLALSTARQLRTDDTYDFSRALKRVTDAVRALQEDGSDAAVSRRDAVIHCLRAAWPLYEAKLWAKTPVESCVTLAAEKRHLFSEKQRERLDRLTTAMRERQRGKKVVVTATRQAETVYHPLHNNS
ncbi:hypothetical protein M885DRAFT_504624 [Pelagophyceae sp. CCMP2097]|nr:hypothetical protein M885DRAFT_504624 [Pelagophyceae sp. CCMP2097]